MISASTPAPSADAVLSDTSNEPPPVRRGGQVYFAAIFTAQVAALLRYVTLARILGPEQLGLAAILILTSSFFDLVSDTGSDKFLVQDRHGDDEAVQRLAQLVFIGRGLLIAVSLSLVAIPLAHFYKAPQLVGAFAILGVSPLIMGFSHLDNRRAQRHLDFRSEAVITICAEAAGFLATIAAAVIVRNFTAVLYGLITRALTSVLVSHLRAKRPYGLGYAKAHAGRLALFGAPLMLNGVMLFIGSQGDRVVVANQLGVRELGHYSAVLLLIYYPAATLNRYISAMYTPLVAACRDDPAGRDRILNTLGGQTTILATAMSVGFAVVAPVLVTILYGARFALPALTIGLIGALQTARYMIVWPTTGALATGRSRTVLVTNLTRLIVFPAALAGLWLDRSLVGVVGGFLVGEWVSVLTGLALMNCNNGRSLFAGFDRCAFFGVTTLTIIELNLAVRQGSVPGLVVGGVLALALGTWIAWRERDAFREIGSLAGRLASQLRSRTA